MKNSHGEQESWRKKSSKINILDVDYLKILCYNKSTKLILKGGGQNDKLNTDKINCRFVRKLTYIVTS